MNLMRTTKPSFNRRALATQAMQAAITTRAKAKLDQHGPICIYGLCGTLGVTVRFNNINMEGMYQRGAPPRIHLSARRPLPRRAYNCAHELGHHVFGHGNRNCGRRTACAPFYLNECEIRWVPLSYIRMHVLMLGQFGVMPLLTNLKPASSFRRPRDEPDQLFRAVRSRSEDACRPEHARPCGAHARGGSSECS
jgi:hypothetical protein